MWYQKLTLVKKKNKQNKEAALTIFFFFFLSFHVKPSVPFTLEPCLLLLAESPPSSTFISTINFGQFSLSLFLSSLPFLFSLPRLFLLRATVSVHFATVRVSGELRTSIDRRNGLRRQPASSSPFLVAEKHHFIAGKP